MRNHWKIWGGIAAALMIIPIVIWQQPQTQNAGPSARVETASMFSADPQIKKPGVKQPPPRWASPNPPKPLPEGYEQTNIPYYTLLAGMKSVLLLNNTTDSPTPVDVTLYNTEGRAQQLAPMDLSANTIKQINLGDVVGSDLFDEGNIQIAYHARMMGITAQVSVSSAEKRVSFESREQDTMDFKSSNLAGIIDLPDGDSTGFLALTNTAPTALNVTLSIGSKKHDVQVYPRESHVLKLNDYTDAKPGVTLITLAHNGKAGDIITTGYVVNLKSGYSSAFIMQDPAAMPSNHLAGAHFWAGQSRSSDHVPEGVSFSSPLLLANVSSQPISAHVWVDYSVRDATPQPKPKKPGMPQRPVPDKVTNVDLRDLTIAPGEVKRVELADALSSVSDSILDTGVDILYDGPKGSLIGKLTSVDQSGDLSFEVPIIDPATMPGVVGGNYPFTLDNGASTVLHVKNTAGKPKEFIVELNFPDGTSYDPEIYALQPNETMAIDIQKLKDENKPDIHKNTFPKSATHGQLVWLEVKPELALIGRAEQLNPNGTLASSFSCMNFCPCGGTISDSALDPSSATLDLNGENGEADFIAYKWYSYCGRGHDGPYYMNESVWEQGDDGSVVSLDNDGTAYNTAHAVGAGQTWVGAYAYSDIYDTDGESCWWDGDAFVEVTAQVTVNCGDDRDALRTEYAPGDGVSNYKADFLPACGEFVAGSYSDQITDHFQWHELNTSQYQHEDYPGTSILRSSLLTGMENTRSANGNVSLTVNSGYRSPLVQYIVNSSTPHDRHIHGDATDFDSDSSTWRTLHNAAIGSQACVEPFSLSGYSHVHEDYRDSCPNSDWESLDSTH